MERQVVAVVDRGTQQARVVKMASPEAADETRFRDDLRDEGPPPQVTQPPAATAPPAEAVAPPRHRRRRLVLLLLALLVIGGGGAGAWWWTHREVAAALPTLYGNIDIREVQLAFNGSQRITTINVDEGDKVTTGELLGTLDTRQLDAQIAAAKAAIGMQQATLDKLVAGNRPEEIAEARATLDAAKADAVYAAAEYDRLSKLLASASGSTAVSRSQVEQAKDAADSAAAKANVAEKALDLQLAGSRQEDIDQGRAALEQAKAQLALLERQHEDASLIAPANATVLSRLAEPGDMATPTRPVLSLAVLDPKWVRAYVSEPDLGKVHMGMGAKVTVDSFPGQSFDGWVGFISPVAEFTPKTVETSELRTSLVYEVRVFVNDPNDVLRLGMPATVELVEGQPGATGQ